MEGKDLCFKALLFENGTVDVRLFTINAWIAKSYALMKEKLQIIFPNLRGSNFKITWKDSDGDEVTISSDEEIIAALREMKEDVNVLYVTSVQKSKPDVQTSCVSVPALQGPQVDCNVCNRQITGFRYMCMRCPNYYICSDCEHSGHHSDHFVLRLLPKCDAIGKNNFALDHVQMEPTRPICYAPQYRMPSYNQMYRVPPRFVAPQSRGIFWGNRLNDVQTNGNLTNAHVASPLGRPVWQCGPPPPATMHQAQPTAVAPQSCGLFWRNNLIGVQTNGNLTNAHVASPLESHVWQCGPPSHITTQQTQPRFVAPQPQTNGDFTKAKVASPFNNESRNWQCASSTNGNASKINAPNFHASKQEPVAAATGNDTIPACIRWKFLNQRLAAELQPELFKDSAQEVLDAIHSVEQQNTRYAEGLKRLLEMGFSNETGSLTRLLEIYKGDVNFVIDAIITLDLRV